MKAQIVSLKGEKVSEMELPKQFSVKVDEQLIKRAVLASNSAQVQSNSPYSLAGRENTAVYIGARHKPHMYRTINVGHARKPRLKNRRGLISGQVASIPAVVKGPRAHPPKANKVIEEKINKKERKKALESAIAATASKEAVAARGHVFGEKVNFPIIVESKIEEVAKTKQLREALEAIGLWIDVERAKEKRQIRAGKGKKRGRRYKKRKSLLIVAEKNDAIYKSGRNMEGVDVIRVNDLNSSLLAPGAVPGRLTVWTENAIKALSGEKK